MPIRRTARILSFVLVLLSSSALLVVAGEKEHPWEHAKVNAQDLNSSPAGAYAAPIGTATVAVPIYRTSNLVVVETDAYRFQWREVGRKPVVLPVNGFIDFYRDGDWFIVLDSKHKKHKFALVGMTAREQK
jgi:hypothetical protein